MKPAVVILFTFFLCISSYDSDTNEGVDFQATISFPSPEVAPSTARVFLNGGALQQIPRSDGKFNFYDLKDGAYSMHISHRDFEFLTYRIQVNAGQLRLFIRGRATRLPQPYRIVPITATKYKPPKQPFNPLSFLKSGYGMMMCFMVFTAVLLPYIAKTAEPQQRRRRRRRPTQEENQVQN